MNVGGGESPSGGGGISEGINFDAILLFLSQ